MVGGGLMILFFIFLFICIFYNELVFLLQKEKESRKIVRPPKMTKLCGENGTRVLCWDSVDWYSSSGGKKKITLIDKCSNELCALQFQIPTYGNFSFVLDLPFTRNQELCAMKLLICSVISTNEYCIKARCPTVGE